MTADIRWKLRFANLHQVFARLEEACAQEEYSHLELAGLVQTYQFTFELCWKTLKDLLTFEGYDVHTPRETIRKAFGISLIDNADQWFDALDNRNLLSHVYDESTAKQAQSQIKNGFTPMLRKCIAALQEKMYDGLTPQYREVIRTILAKVDRIDRAVLFGSRTLGTFGKTSDIDLALEGQNLTLSDLAFLRGEFAESSLPYEVDIILRADISNPELESLIEKQGITFYEK